MYSYTPKLKKQREKLSSGALFALGLAAFLPTLYPKTPLPALFQLVSLLLLTASLSVFIRYVMRDYTYAVERNEQGSDIPDFVITERYGKRLTVVCRVSVKEVETAVPVIEQNREDIKAMVKGKRLFTYIAERRPNHLYLLKVRMDGEVFYLKIVADDRLISLLMDH